MTGTEQRRNIPQLRFPEFEDNWTTVNLCSISEIYDGTHQTPKYVESGVPFVSVENIKDIENPGKYITKEAFEKFKIKPQKNDILMTRITAGIIGDTAIVRNNNPLGYYVSLALIRKNDNTINVNYLEQRINSQLFKKELHKRIIHIAFPKKINLGEIGYCKIGYPTPPEQTKIANFLTAVDKRINLLQKKKAGLEQYKKGVMQRIFVSNHDSKNVLNHDSKDLHDDHDLRNQEIKNQGNQEYQAKSRFRLRFKQDDGSDFPDWEEKKLGEVSSITTGSSNRQDSGLDGEYTFFDRSEDIRTSNIYLFDGEAIIVGGEGSDFVPKYFVGKFDLHQRSYAIMNFKNASGMFLFYYIHYFRKYFLSQAVGSTVKSLRLPMFQKMPISLPCIPEQQKIANFLSTIDKSIEKLGKQIEQSQEWEKGLLQKMFV